MAGQFVPFKKLLEMQKKQEKFKTLNPEQQEVLTAHTIAADSWNEFQKTGQKRIIGKMFGRGTNQLSNITEEEDTATFNAIYALETAMKYYHQHGKIEQAYTELREIAEQYWHPVIHEMWEHHFANRARHAEISLPEGLSYNKLHGLYIQKEIAKAEESENQGVENIPPFKPSEVTEHQMPPEKKSTTTGRQKPFKKIPPSKN